MARPRGSLRRNGRFINPEAPNMGSPRRFVETWKWLLTRPRSLDPDLPFPIVRNEVVSSPPERGMRVTYVGHATLLVQAGGRSILTDPIWSQRCSPLSWAGPARITQPGLSWEELPPIDAVLVSHSHYDHCDQPTIQRLGARPLYVVPKGMGPWMKRQGLTRVREMDWWQHEELLDFEVTCTPAQHFSARAPHDGFKSLWCSFFVRVASSTFFFAGDTGYFSGFRNVRERCGPPDVAAIPVGAYKPRRIMKPVHLNPPEAVQAFQDLGAKYMVPIHWGTFRLTDEPLREPIRWVKREWREEGLARESLMLLRHGESRTVSG